MASTQTLISIPKVQTEDRTVNQLQQNIIDAFRKLQSSIMNLATSIGDVQMSMLTEDQFQQQRGDGWVLINGQSVKGSKYAQLTGFDTLPQAGGTFPRFKDNGAGLNPDGDTAIGTYQADQFQGHWHQATARDTAAGGEANLASGDAGTPANVTGNAVKGALTDGVNGSPRTGSETRPKCITYNAFLRIN